MDRKIILSEGNPPELVGDWKVVEVLSAAEFLKTWIEQQTITTETKDKKNPRAAV